MSGRVREFGAGEAGKSLVSLLAGEIGFGERFEDVRPQLEALSETQKKSLVLLVACDRIYGFFENREGTANGPRLVKLVRDLARELGLKNVGGGGDVSKEEARTYFDKLAKMGVGDYIGELGEKNVFGTVWECINEMVGKKEVTLEESLGS